MHKKMNFSIKDFFSKCVTSSFTEETLNGKLHFCAVYSWFMQCCLQMLKYDIVI